MKIIYVEFHFNILVTYVVRNTRRVREKMFNLFPEIFEKWSFI